MKFLIFFAGLLALGLATEFKVMDGNTTCIMVEVSGSFEYKTKVNGTEKTVSLDLSKAQQLEKNSTCESLKLYFEKEDTQVWFNFSVSDDKQVISLVSAFSPSNLFNTSNNESVVFQANSAFQSPQNDSYKCVSQVSTALEGPKDVNITVTAVLKDFQAQSSDIKGGTFNNATECSQDKTTTSTPTTPTTTPTTPTTTKKPPEPTYHVDSGNGTTCINMTGEIAFAITYETKSKGQNMSMITIPADHTVNGSCKYMNSSDLQVIDIEFYDHTWKVSMMFTRQDSSYYISEIGLTYVYDDHLPDAMLSGQTETVMYNTTDNYGKASVKGYYYCSSNLTQALNSNVTFSTKDFKYRAFNDEKTAPLDSGSVSECSQDDDSNSIVPIAVGAALAGLVVIVLIAYLIGRRRSKKSGYESV